VTDDEGIPFWDAFEQLGGVETLGYPCSRRFVWQGFVCQVMQKGVLQWNPVRNEVQLVNVLDYLSAMGLDDWLQKHDRIPRLEAVTGRDVTRWDDVARAHYALLDDAPITRAFYFSSPTNRALLGLPQSKPEEFDSCYAVRFQRGALYLWKEREGGNAEGQITLAAVGEIAREAGLFDRAAFVPEYRSAAREAVAGEGVSSNRVLSSRGGSRYFYGLATWYGADFQGCEMRNGEAYDMYDPTTTASNVFPLGSLLRVTNIHSGESVVVRVTDTGAFTYPVIVDLSWAAFRQLANPGLGVLDVTVERLQ